MQFLLMCNELNNCHSTMIGLYKSIVLCYVSVTNVTNVTNVINVINVTNVLNVTNVKDVTNVLNITNVTHVLDSHEYSPLTYLTSYITND